LYLSKKSRYNRLVDISPTSDVDRSDVVSRPSEAAELTFKLISCRSVVLRYMLARGTSSRGIARINNDHGNASYQAFVLNKGSEQGEAPFMQAATLSLSNGCPRSYALEIFKGNRSLGVFSLSYQLFGNAMINVSGEPSHPTRKLFQVAFSRRGTSALESGFQRIESVPSLVNLFPRMDLAIGINCEVLNTEIDTKNASWVVGGFFRDFDHRTEIEYPVLEEKVNLPSNPVESGLLILTKPNWYKLSPLEGGDRDILQTFPRQNSFVVDDSTIGSKLWFDRLISLVCFHHLGYGPNRKLSRESKLLSDIIVNGFVDLDLVCLAHHKDGFSYVVTRLIEAIHGIKKHLVLIFRRVEFNHQGLKNRIEENVQLVNNFRCIGTATYRLLKGWYPAWSSS
jgi:hypothetical protein